eukprot:TRINITY_DN2162_c0_g5_i2.p1 TRINITY_DN2162_c0_g5~~TRINITY_DN2162_c0_g5_i2.p1  ORF type:complete len:218 (-),score=51.26 TRINITY_DN2162_c0_g5_i2:50-658(-)
MLRSLVGSEMCIRDRIYAWFVWAPRWLIAFPAEHVQHTAQHNVVRQEEHLVPACFQEPGGRLGFLGHGHRQHTHDQSGPMMELRVGRAPVRQPRVVSQDPGDPARARHEPNQPDPKRDEQRTHLHQPLDHVPLDKSAGPQHQERDQASRWVCPKREVREHELQQIYRQREGADRGVVHDRCDGIRSSPYSCLLYTSPSPRDS